MQYIPVLFECWHPTSKQCHFYPAENRNTAPDPGYCISSIEPIRISGKEDRQRSTVDAFISIITMSSAKKRKDAPFDPSDGVRTNQKAVVLCLMGNTKPEYKQAMSNGKEQVVIDYVCCREGCSKVSVYSC